MSSPQIIHAQAPQVEPELPPSAAAREPVCIILFGATGDLAGRKLFPALFALWQGGFLPESFVILGVAVNPLHDDQFRERARQSIDAHGRIKPANADEWNRFAQHLYFQPVNFTQPESFRGLADRLQSLRQKHNLPDNHLFYLAVAPSFFATVIEQLSANQLVSRPNGNQGWSRIVIEKPFGRDLASGKALNKDIHRFLDEEQIYRIDHYLGKETVQNILAFRFANSIFEPLLNNYFVDHVQITVAETVGMEGKRGGYYDTAGAIRDVMQNHVLQLLAYTTMNAPGGLKANNIRSEKLRILENLVPFTDVDVGRSVVRGQYGAGTVEGKAVPAYRDEIGVAKDSNTDTYVALRLQIDTWRWADVPFLLRTGKRLPSRATEVAIRFKDRPLRDAEALENEHDGCDFCAQEANVLVFRIQPNEGTSLSFLTKRPGMGFALRPVQLEFDYDKAFQLGIPEAYERLLLDAIKGFQLLFMRAEEVDAQWAFITPILEAWEKQPPPSFPNYAAGTWGPTEANHLTKGCQGGWRKPE